MVKRSGLSRRLFGDDTFEDCSDSGSDWGEMNGIKTFHDNSESSCESEVDHFDQKKNVEV